MEVVSTSPGPTKCKSLAPVWLHGPMVNTQQPCFHDNMTDRRISQKEQESDNCSWNEVKPKGPSLASHLWPILERWQVTHTRITIPAQLLVSREKQESTLSYTSVHHPTYPCSAFDSDPELKLEAPLSLLREESLPCTFLLCIELISGPRGGGQWWRSSCNRTTEVRDILAIQTLLNLQWSFILINPFWRGFVLNKNAFNSYVHWHNFSNVNSWELYWRLTTDPF